jgi:DNA-binding XRE family transcriptional regulator
MPARINLASPLENELLVQLGQRLRSMRKARACSSVEQARTVGISRSTLHAVEKGDPSVAMGTYLRVLSSLGLAADLALVASSTPAR